MDMNVSAGIPAKSSARDVFLYLAAVIALGVCAGNVGTIIFQLINRWIPDPVQAAYIATMTSDAVRFSVAALVVALPLFVWLSWRVNRDIELDPSRRELRVRKWLLYLTLFVAGSTVAGDAVSLVWSYLQGDFTLRFLLKVVTILVIAGSAFFYYLRQLHGDPRGIGRWVGRVMVGLSVVVLVVGLVIAGSPATQRKLQRDQQRISALQGIESQLIYFWQSKQQLPVNIDGLRDQTIGGYIPPNDPVTGKSYEYRAVGAMSYELCAVFDLPSRDFVDTSVPARIPAQVSSWTHGEGRQCFTGIIDPQLYPVNPKLIK
jgi:hypothetical protein